MSDPTQTPDQPTILGEILPEELEQLTMLKQQADQVLHQMSVHHVQGMRMDDQFRRLEQMTNQTIMAAGKRLGIPDGTAWSVTADGKAIQVGAPPMPARPTLVPVPGDEDSADQG